MDTMKEGAPSATGKVVTALIVGLLIGFVAGAFWQERRLGADALPKDEAAAVANEKEKGGEKTSAATSAPSDGLASVVVSGGVSIEVSDQPAGAAVVVGKVTSGETVWVAVREGADGALGNILGVQKVAAGEQNNITVELLRGTQSGKQYAVVLYRDVGAPAFNYREDVLLSGVESRFTAK